MLATSTFLKANEDSENNRVVNCLQADSDSNVTFEIQKQLINPGRMFVIHVGKELHDFNFIYKTPTTMSRHYRTLKPPMVEGLT